MNTRIGAFFKIPNLVHSAINSQAETAISTKLRR